MATTEPQCTCLTNSADPSKCPADDIHDCICVTNYNECMGTKHDCICLHSNKCNAKTHNCYCYLMFRECHADKHSSVYRV